MERDMNQSALPTLCRAGCGFYGSSVTDGFCSKCFKDTLKRRQDPNPGRISPSATPKSNDTSSAAAVAAAIESIQTVYSASASATSTAASHVSSVSVIENESVTFLTTRGDDESLSGSASSSSGVPSDNQDVDMGADKATDVTSSSTTKQKNRCDQCRKRVGLTGFECRCGGMYCAIHRYSDMHQCSFDYKALGEKEIRKNNPVVKTEKVQKI